MPARQLIRYTFYDAAGREHLVAAFVSPGDEVDVMLQLRAQYGFLASNRPGCLIHWDVVGVYA